MDENKDKINNKYLLPPKTSNKKTLVLDLDETLVHSQFLQFSCPSDIIIKIEIEKEIYDIHVLVRPGVKDFLEIMEKYYEIVIFTASISKYADILLNIIDPKGSCPYRLFREHCTFINNIFVKDLQKLGRDLKDIIIVDNSPLSYSFHPNNGLPILSWFEDRNDRELYNITPILIFLSKVNDVREYIPKLVIDNTISYIEVSKIFKNYGFNFEKIKNINTNRNNANMNISNANAYKNNIYNSLKNINENENEKQMNSNEYNINIQILQNNNNFLDDKENKDLKNNLIKYLSLPINNNELNNKIQKQINEKLLKIKQKNIISNIDNPCNNKISNKVKDNNKGHKRQNTFNENINYPKPQKEKNYKKINNINKNNKHKIKKLIHKLYSDSIRKKDNSEQFKIIQNLINKKLKREREKTPININRMKFSLNNNSNNKIKRISFQKNKIPTSVRKKRNNSNNNRTKLSLLNESSENNLLKKLFTVSCKTKINNNSNNINNNQKRNMNQINLLQYKAKFKSNNNFQSTSNKVEIMNNSINIKKHSSNSKIYRKFKIFENSMIPCHRKQKSYNENNFFIKIKKNLIKPNELKTRRFLSKNDFLKSEIQKANNNTSNQRNINNNVSDYKNKLIKKTYGNFKKINLKSIDFITKRDKKKIQIDLKEKNFSSEYNNNMNINTNGYMGLNINENIFNLYKTLNRNEKIKKDDNIILNNTSDNFLNEKNTFRRINHQKTISYNLNSNRNLNNIMMSKSKLQNKYKIVSKIKSAKRYSSKDFNSIQDLSKRYKKEKEDSSLDMRNIFKNKFFDNNYNNTKDINKNNIKSKNKGLKNINKNNISNKKNIIN